MFSTIDTLMPLIMHVGTPPVRPFRQLTYLYVKILLGTGFPADFSKVLP